ncbi:CRE-DHS-2 protein [Aphelenchoides avenae]|nr:CRE-DHS-2 protein [Aphelenchus avenae]
MIAFLIGWAFTLLFIYFVVTNFLERIPIQSVSDKPVLITGCDSGFGFDLALKCIGQGMPVFAGCLTEQGKIDLTAKAKTIRDGSRLLDAFTMDVRSQESVEAARDYIKPKLEAYKGLYGLVNNAGIVGNSGVDDMLTPQDYQLAWEVNTLGVIRVTQVFKPFIKKTRGRIVTVSSICARLGLPAIGPYTASKHAVEGYMDVIRQELSDYGVSVSILEPGFFKTPLLNAPRMVEMVERVWQRAPKEVQEEYGDEYLRAGTSLCVRRKPALDL